MSGQIHFDPPQPADLTAMLPGYDVHSLIATGGMGAVYRATHISLDRAVAIKVLPAEFADATFHDQFQAEARAMAKLNHPNLIGIYDFGQANGLPFIVMEFVAGKSLYYSAYKKAIEESTAVRIIREICAGLTQAHKHDIIHRDIKPANILMDPDAHAKIGDFGLASHDGSTQEVNDDIIFGTPGYAAPEIIHNQAAIGKPSDIFAVGVILYELLTGHLPDENNPRPASRIANTDPRLDRVIRKATHSNPAMRYQDAAEMAEDLKQISNSETPRASANQLAPPGSPNAAPRKTSRLGNKRSGAVQASSRSSKSQAVSTKKTTPILTKPKKITGKIPAKTNEHREENTDLSVETKVNLRTKPSRPKAYKSLENTSPVPPASTFVQTSTNWPFIRNCLIIAVLAPLLIFLWGMYQKKQTRLVEEQKEQIEKQKAAREASSANNPLLPTRTRPTPPPNRLTIGNDNTVASPTDNGPVVRTKTPLDQLSELQRHLATGKRSTMPDAAIERGTKYLMPITKKMTWSAASRFAEEYGAHLATPTSAADLAWFAENLPHDMPKIWIGGGAQGENGWGWVTGEEWNHRQPSTDLGTCALIDSSGSVRSAPDIATYPFYLQWNKDGLNPGSFSAQMDRVKVSLNTPNPVWPPGTITFQTRHYYYVHNAVDWEEADILARSGGGHLLVCSDRSESAFLQDALQRSIPQGQSAWLGARYTQEEWRWCTGEPFTHPQWLPGSPKSNSSHRGIRLLSDGDDTGWESANPYLSLEADGFIIEWSKDKNRDPSETSTPTKSSNGKLAKIQKIGRSSLKKYLVATEKRLSENRKTFLWDLDIWPKRLTKNEKRVHGPRVARFVATLPKGTNAIPSDLKQKSLHPDVRKIYSDALNTQRGIYTEFENNLMRLRKAYINKLLEAQQEAQSGNLSRDVAAIRKELAALGQDTASFRSHLEQ